MVRDPSEGADVDGPPLAATYDMSGGMKSGSLIMKAKSLLQGGRKEVVRSKA